MFQGKLIIALSVILSATILTTCSLTQGGPEGMDDLGFKKCSTAADCSLGSFCGEDKICTAQCGNDKDCFVFDTAAQAKWAEAQRKGYTLAEARDAGLVPDPALHCSSCGRCLPVGKEDDSCVAGGGGQAPAAKQCTSDSACSDEPELGAGYVCDSDGFCTYGCSADEDCTTNMGVGHVCRDDADRKGCRKFCWADSFCSFFGWQWKCKLPEGVDQAINYFDVPGVEGYCVADPKGVDWGTEAETLKAASPEGAKYVGVYGTIMLTSVANCGLPIGSGCQDVGSIQHLLTRVRQTPNGLEFDEVFCNIHLNNFFDGGSGKDNKKDYPFLDIAYMMTPFIYFHSVPWIHLEAAESDIAPAAEGTKFDTDRWLEIRAAILENPETDPLPNTKNELTNHWDQDRDGKPGQTTAMAGAIQGETYNDQRWSVIYHMEVQKMAEDKVDKLNGLLTHTSEQFLLGASKPQLLQDLTTTVHDVAERSYFRMRRLKDDASCYDVLDLGDATALNARQPNCDSDPNMIAISPEDDKTWLCYTPVLDPVPGPPP